jgi:putative endonuclease
MSNIGKLGEEFVVQWLKTQNYEILHQRWRCRWGEIDIIAQENESLELAFVEVKTRNLRNWDENGLLAINVNKQTKVLQTAAIFFSKYPHLADLPCHFDVGLVTYNSSNIIMNKPQPTTVIKLNQPLWWKGYIFTLREYIKGAFIST